MTWSPTNLDRPLTLSRIGILRDQARLYLSSADASGAIYEIRLLGLFKLFDNLPRHVSVEITDEYPHGSFGWDSPEQAPHHSIKLSADTGGFLMALAREVEYHIATVSELKNWPG